MQTASNGASTSIWQASAPVPAFPPLAHDSQADVCVIGAGIAGLSTAYLLSQLYQKVVLIDALGIGAGETGRTTAHFFPPDEWYASIEKSFGPKHAALVADSFSKAITKVETIVHKEHIDCAFERVSGYLYAPPESRPNNIDQEFEAARRAGESVRRLGRVPGLSFDTGPCIEFRHQAQFHPLKYLSALAQAVVRSGSEIYCGTRALGISGDDTWQKVRTDHGTIVARSVVVATNTPFNNRVVMHTKQAAYRTYVIGVRVPKGSVPRMLLWDTGDPYFYVRLETPDPNAGHDILIVGGADHKVGQDSHPEHRYDEIERWTRAHFPMTQAVQYRWSGEVMEPSDGPAFLGRNPVDDRNVYIITGDSGNGMTHCTIGALLVSDLIMGHDNPWTALYDPARKVIHGLADFISEQANTVARYGDWISAGEVASLADIAAGTGAIVREGVHKLAVYRDQVGALHTLSAKCTHLGCQVHFNSAERSWDCPCHGSRFDIDGTVLHGPASAPLKKIHVHADETTPG
jgi:glycine/D-amino acid oxidase-like deaminating enzyme/nitrite reductase/ring-hydroxylating ferredoxin subunit